MTRIKWFLRKLVLVLPWIALLAIGVWFASQALSNWIVDEFVTTTHYEQKLNQ